MAVIGDELVIPESAKKWMYGSLEIPTLHELRQQNSIETYTDALKVEEIIANVQDLHCAVENTNALFQVASQFNLLEMVHPGITPELGIDRYEDDFTQGPACAIACGAATIYRNYFVEVNGQVGQTEQNQIDCLNLIGDALDNNTLHLWTMKNGYALLTEQGLLTINKKIAQMTSHERENLKSLLKVGIQWHTEVTLAPTKHKVSQIFCSALPVGYSSIDFYYWEAFSRVVLEALYEATLYAGFVNMKKNNCNVVYLTLVGGGAFGNQEYWILESMIKALTKFKKVPLDVKVVSYGKTNDCLTDCLERFKLNR